MVVLITNGEISIYSFLVTKCRARFELWKKPKILRGSGDVVLKSTSEGENQLQRINGLTIDEYYSFPFFLGSTCMAGVRVP
jgi:hypothetical protein